MQRTVDHLHLLLMGKTGSGVSASANTILGHKVFPSDIRLTSVTDRCLKHTAEVLDRRVSVLDTPSFFTSNDTDLRAELRRGLEMCSEGVHALILVLPLHTFSKQDIDVLSMYKQMFGENAMKYTVVLFTHGDELQNKSIEQLIRSNTHLSRLTEECGGGFHLLNNRDLSNRDQVSKLLMKIERMVSENENRCYTLQMFEAQSLSSFPNTRHLCAISIVVVFAMGCVSMDEGSWYLTPFLHGCVGGIFSALAGAASGHICVRIWHNQSQRIMIYTKRHLRTIRLQGILCGCASGGITVCIMGPVGLSNALLGVTEGGFVAYTTIMSQCR